MSLSSMELPVLLFMVFFAVKALSQDVADWVSIDCGSTTNYYTGGNRYWQRDDQFIRTGKNELVSQGQHSSELEMLNTLRVFTQQNKNCYILPTPTSARYFIRAAFHYGDYDGLSKPPTFDLEFDGNKWATVETSLTDPIYYELVYANMGDNVSVCLARTNHDEFPFISSLELWPLADKMYAGMSRDLAWLQSYRYNYGASDDDWIYGYPVDEYNRIWKPVIPSGLNPVLADFTDLYYTTVEYPPTSAIITAVEAPNLGDTIRLPFTFTKSNTLNHVVVYFTEVIFANETRSFDLYVNDKLLFTISPEYENCSGAWINALTASTLNVELRPNADSVLPPIISAIEVYTAGDPLVTTGTPQDDLDGLAILIDSFKQLEGWSGEPCLPRDTVWQWLNCTGNDPPRVSSLNLSGYGLVGSLPDFSQMQALETIDLGNNSLDGSIPDFLGQLPSLQFLNLSHNNFSGKVPESITKNKKIKYLIKGNPYLPHHKGKNLALILGLAIGLPAGIGLLIVLVLLLLYRQKLLSRRGKATTGLGKNQSNGTAQGSTEGQSGTNQGNGTAHGMRQEENVSVSPRTEGPSNEHITDAERISHSSGTMSRAELDELIRLQHGRA